MTLADRIEEDIKGELRDFMVWLAIHWKDDPKGGDPIPALPDDPRLAFTEGWDRCLTSIVDAWDVYNEDFGY